MNIAKRERDLEMIADSPLLQELKELAGRVQRALREALDSFVNADPIGAENVIRDDTEIDHLNSQFIGTLLSGTHLNREESERVLAMSSISRYLERIGDHSTNIAEMVIYYVRGNDVRHKQSPVAGVVDALIDDPETG